MNIEKNYPLSQVTTFHIGGPADFFTVAESVEDLKEALNFSKEKKIPIQVLGKGSNVLISDTGYRGLVVLIKIPGLTFNDSGLVSIGAGENWDDICNQAVTKNMAGIECLSGIPGSAGGALVQNVGAYGQTISDLVTSVNVVELATEQQKTFSVVDCQFAYRNSFFKANPNKFIVTSFQLQLKPGGESALNYAHVKKHFENKPKPTLVELRKFILNIRASKGYLIMPGIESYNTAGSFFKNPVIPESQFEKLKPIFGDESLNRFWPIHNGIKLAAAFLVQEAGFVKGYRDGDVGISPKHSLSVVNFGKASGSDVKSFADKIKTKVLEKFGVSLEEEILYVGKFN